MKISVSRQFNDNHGHSHFMNSLIESLKLINDVKFVDQNSPSDINLIVVNGDLKKRSKNILRLDGVYYDRPRINANYGISRCIRNVDGVVFQSKWAESFVTKMTGVIPKLSTVIYNGMNQALFKNAGIDKYGFDKVFIACAMWRPNKRGGAIIKAFMKMKNLFSEKLGLFMIGGNCPKDIIDDSVLYFGEVDHDKLFSLYKSSDYLVHISHLDACSNTVVEGLSVGLPVLCNNIGGTPELVKGDGLILPLDKPFNFQFLKSMNEVGDKSIDIDLISKGMVSMTERAWNVSRPDLDIHVAAKSYHSFFEKVLS